MSAATQTREEKDPKTRQGLDYHVTQVGFTSESDDAALDGTIMIRTLRPLAGKEQRFKKSFHLVPDDDRGESEEADRLRELLGLEGKKIVLRPTAGFFPRPDGGMRVDGKYRVRARRKVNRYGDKEREFVLVFPATRHELQEGSWLPAPQFMSGKLEFQHGSGKFWFGQHPETGQAILTWGEVPMTNIRTETRNGRTVEVATVDTTGLMIKPWRTEGYWVLGKAKVIEGLNEGQIVAFDEDFYHSMIMETTAYAPEFYINGEAYTAWEIFGTPKPAKASEPEKLISHFVEVKRTADRARRDLFMFASHPDGWSEEITAFLSAGQLRVLRELATTNMTAIALAYEWYEMICDKIIGNLERVKIAGLPASKSDAALPLPRQRKQRKTALCQLTVAEIRDQMLIKIGAKKAKVAKKAESGADKADGKEKKGAPAKGTPKKSTGSRPGRRSPEERRKAHITPETRTAYETATTGAESPVAAAMREALAENGVTPETDSPGSTPADEEPAGKKPASHYFGFCSVCQERKVRTTKPELSGKVIPGARCKKCAKNRKK
jgi:hypothetical protein